MHDLVSFADALRQMADRDGDAEFVDESLQLASHNRSQMPSLLQQSAAIKRHCRARVGWHYMSNPVRRSPPVRHTALCRSHPNHPDEQNCINKTPQHVPNCGA